MCFEVTFCWKALPNLPAFLFQMPSGMKQSCNYSLHIKCASSLLDFSRLERQSDLTFLYIWVALKCNRVFGWRLLFNNLIEVLCRVASKTLLESSDCMVCDFNACSKLGSVNNCITFWANTCYNNSKNIQKPKPQKQGQLTKHQIAK